MSNIFEEMREKLKSSGYRYFPGKYISHPNADEGWQKVIRLKDKKAYFINIYLYKPRVFLGGVPYKGGWCPTVRFYFGEYDSVESFDVELHPMGNDLEAIENCFKMMYDRLGCCPDIHNND